MIFCARAAAHVADVTFFKATTIVLHEHYNNVSIPRSELDAFKFNVRQYEEFRIMGNEAFYRKIKKSKLYQNKLFSLKLEIARFYLRKKNVIAFARSFSKALTYNPGFIFGAVIRKASRKVWKTNPGISN